jgi:hypothetical protein
MGRMVKHVSKSQRKRSPVSETLSRMSPESCTRHPRHRQLDVSSDVDMYTE